VRIRRAAEQDIPDLLPLVRELTDVEHQLDAWAVTAALTREHATRRTPPDFGCLVVESGDSGLVGLASYYVCRFAGGIKPTLYVNGIFVVASLRRRGIAGCLVRALAREAGELGCSAMAWQIARRDPIAVQFSERQGARADSNGVDYRLAREAVRWLATLSLDDAVMMGSANPEESCVTGIR
jgi:GNAT superfamily N-acetyltransferase